jgi:hypothetical protein
MLFLIPFPPAINLSPLTRTLKMNFHKVTNLFVRFESSISTHFDPDYFLVAQTFDFNFTVNKFII